MPNDETEVTPTKDAIEVSPAQSTEPDANASCAANEAEAVAAEPEAVAAEPEAIQAKPEAQAEPTAPADLKPDGSLADI